MNLLCPNRSKPSIADDYATRDDLFTEDMTALHLLAYLLTGDHDKSREVLRYRSRRLRKAVTPFSRSGRALGLSARSFKAEFAGWRRDPTTPRGPESLRTLMQNSKALQLDMPQSRLYSPWETSSGLSLFCPFSSDTPIRIVLSFYVVRERTLGRYEYERYSRSLRSGTEMERRKMTPQERRKLSLADGGEW